MPWLLLSGCEAPLAPQGPARQTVLAPADSPEAEAEAPPPSVRAPATLPVPGAATPAAQASSRPAVQSPAARRAPGAMAPARAASGAGEGRAVLDLSLPPALLARFAEQGDDLPESVPTLLPPLFKESSAAPRRFELGGRLLTTEPDPERDDYWDSIEGAELELRFRP